jgi:hypothetical protein
MTGGEVVARWSVRRRRARVQACLGCGRVFDGVACPVCGLLCEPVPVAQMALVVELAGGGRRLVMVERGEGGRWFAVRVMAASSEAIRALRRQHEHRPDDESGGGWAA